MSNATVQRIKNALIFILSCSKMVMARIHLSTPGNSGRHFAELLENAYL
jgi:hypothetical protein